MFPNSTAVQVNPRELGDLGEVYVARKLRGVGLNVIVGGVADLVAGGAVIEVKAALKRPYRNGGYLGYQFCLWRDGHTDHRRSDVVVLLCYYDLEMDPVAFVVPTERIGSRRKIVIPGSPWTYTGRWSRWYRRWEVIADYVDPGTPCACGASCSGGEVLG